MQRAIPFVVSGLAVVIALYAALRSPSAVAPSCACEGSVTRADHEKLRRELTLMASMTQRPVSSESRSIATPSSDDAITEPTPSAPAPKLVRFDAPSGLTIEAAADGSVSAHNRDPSLVGKQIVVQAHREDGTSAPMVIFVPPVTP